MRVILREDVVQLVEFAVAPASPRELLLAHPYRNLVQHDQLLLARR